MRAVLTPIACLCLRSSSWNPPFVAHSNAINFCGFQHRGCTVCLLAGAWRAPVVSTVLGGPGLWVFSGLRAGVGRYVLAFLALDQRFLALFAEQDPDARVAAQICLRSSGFLWLITSRWKTSYPGRGFIQMAARPTWPAFVPASFWGVLTKCVLAMLSTFCVCAWNMLLLRSFVRLSSSRAWRGRACSLRFEGLENHLVRGPLFCNHGSIFGWIQRGGRDLQEVPWVAKSPLLPRIPFADGLQLQVVPAGVGARCGRLFFFMASGTVHPPFQDHSSTRRCHSGTFRS